MSDTEILKKKKRKLNFWIWGIASIIFRLILIRFPKNLNLSSRPEVSTPLTSLRRLAEGYWLKQSSISPYAGSMYHGSPLLLSMLGPLTVKRIEEQPGNLLCSLVFVIADFVTALLIRATGHYLLTAYDWSLESLDISTPLRRSGSPFRRNCCSCVIAEPFDNRFMFGLFYSPHSEFGCHFDPLWSMCRLGLLGSFWMGHGSTFFSLSCYSDYTGDFVTRIWSRCTPKETVSTKELCKIRSVYVLLLCGISLKYYGGLSEMFRRTYGFILSVEDLSPNIGVLWYFFAEVFVVFHMNILFMILPLAIRLNHRPCFLAFVYIAIFSMLKSYPSVEDAALYLGLLGLFVNELADMHFTFFIFCGYVGVFLLSPVMHNLWIWRGTGNANLYFATAMAYACLQIILAVESVSAMLNHDRFLRKLSTMTTLTAGKS